MTDKKAEQMTDVILNVFRLNGILTDWGDRFVRSEELTSTRWRMLGAVAMAQTPLTAPQIAYTMGVTRQGALKQLTSLVNSGFMKTLDNPLHKRSPLYTLTERGSLLFDRINTRWMREATKMAETLGKPELQTTVQVLKSLNVILSLTEPKSDL